MEKKTSIDQLDKLRSVSNLAMILNILNGIVFITFAIGQTKLTLIIFSFLTVLGTVLLLRKRDRYIYATPSLIKLISLQRVAIFVVVYFQLSTIFKFQDWSWDGLWYHSPAARVWSRELDFTSLYPTSFSNSYPGGTETFQAIIWHFIPNAPSQIGNYLLFLMILILLRKTLIGLGINSRVVESVLFIFMITPAVFSQASTSYNDEIFGAVVFLSICLGVKFYESGERSLFIGALSLAGIAASIKYQGVALIVITFVTLIFRFILIREDSGNPPFKQKSSFRTDEILLVFCILITGFAWEIKNWINFGNPFYPFDFGVGLFKIVKGPLGSPNTAFLNNESHLAGFVNSPLSFIEAAWHFIPNFTYDARQGGFGVLWPAILLVAVILALKSRDTFQKIFLVSVLLTLITPANWWSRYEIHLFLAGLILTMHVFSGKLNLKGLPLKLSIAISSFQLIIYAPFVGPYPIFFPQPTNLESFKAAWGNSKFMDEFLSIPTKEQKPIAPELSRISKMEGKDIAFWWVEPLILPLLGAGKGNRLFEVKGSKSEIKRQLDAIRPNFFVTRQVLTQIEVPTVCILKKNETGGIYNAQIFECDWSVK